MDNKYKRYGKLAVFYGVVVPMAFIWDVVFGAVELIHKGCKWIDRQGENVIEDLKDYLTR